MKQNQTIPTTKREKKRKENALDARHLYVQKKGTHSYLPTILQKRGKHTETHSNSSQLHRAKCPLHKSFHAVN